MGGGGGDGGYSAKQQQIENQKASARAALNALFGIAPTSTPNQADYQVQNSRGSWSFSPLQGFAPTSLSAYNPADKWLNGSDDPGTSTDPTTYGGAMSVYNKAASDAEANKKAREALYQQVRDNAFSAGKRSIDERKTTAARQNKFALFAQGLNGGSEDIDQNALLDRTYNQGLLDLGSKADSARADMQSSDEQTRLALLQSIDNGMDQGSALSSALGQMKVNADRASAQAQGQTVGDLFGDAGLLYTQSMAAKGTANGRARYGYPYLFGTSAKPASMGSGAGGIITSTGG